MITVQPSRNQTDLTAETQRPQRKNRREQVTHGFVDR